ncbi:hypothetical protein I316_06797 [Kwoniella heveanensis BCC8398]|uniref:Major facilitator superfamily (MFS) profile domain-containing protein n=1 Tax=Kwoniella heveanensis BCC8398 TaxID=1296120 RepID=A0A1B9GKT8_9TREE|nr:hypothetical protein I316_06797 [Kwoniella heveanensis BCC8398]
MSYTDPELPPPTALPKLNEEKYLVGPSKKGPWQKFVSFIWDSDYYEKSDADRRLVFKLDCYMLTALTIGWWLKNLDQNNLANAYVSGMKEDLNIQANQYTYMGTIYNAVVAAMQIPSSFIIMKVRPSWFLAACEIGWGIFTFAQAGANSYQAMYGFRFCIAFFESFYYPCAFFILGSWYTRPELAKRIALWFVAGPAGSAFSGYLQAAIYNNLDGMNGIAGWRYLYIVCGAMTVPCGFILLFLIPDFPENTKIWYLSEEEKALAKARVARNGEFAAMKGDINPKVILSAFRTWHFWVMVPFYLLFGFAVQNGTQFGIYLKANKYSVSMRNVLPSTMYIIQIPCLIIYAYISDRVTRVSRGVIILVPLIWGLFPTGVLAFWGHSNALRVFAFMVNGSIYITPVFYAWVAEMCGKQTELRAFVTGSTSCLFYAFNAWLPAIVFLQTDGPRFKKGFRTTFSCLIASIILTLVMIFMHRRDQQRAAKADQVDQEQPLPTLRADSVTDEEVETKA